jgi:hypothetical protein
MSPRDCHPARFAEQQAEHARLWRVGPPTFPFSAARCSMRTSQSGPLGCPVREIDWRTGDRV